jgi:signal transduction histidine kinase
LQEAAARAALPTTVDADGVARYRPEVEAAVYYCCLEALQNAGKHAGEGARATVTLRRDDGVLRFEVVDDGRGFAPAAVNGSDGLRNMADRLGAFGGTCTVTSSPGAGTRVAGSVPVAGL